MITLSLHGDKALLRQFQQLEPKLSKKVLRRALRESLKPMGEDAKTLAPKRTGALKRSVKVRSGKRKRGKVGAQIQVSKRFLKAKRFYGAFQEYGTKQLKGKDMLKEAFTRGQKDAQDRFLKLVKLGLKEITG